MKHLNSNKNTKVFILPDGKPYSRKLSNLMIEKAMERNLQVCYVQQFLIFISKVKKNSTTKFNKKQNVEYNIERCPMVQDCSWWQTNSPNNYK